MFSGPRVPRNQMKVTTFLANEEMGLLDFVLKKMDGISRNKAKGLVLTNIPKSIESYFLTLARPDSITFLHCIGADAGITHQSDFRIPISTIEAAYKQLTEEDDGSNDRQ